MLSGIFKYSGSHAKVKAMSSNLLKDEDYKALLSKKSVDDVLAYLKSNTNYTKGLKEISEGAVHRGALEVVLQDSKKKEFVKLFKYEKGANKKFLRVYILRYEIEMLKEMFRMLESGLLITFSDNSNEYYKRYMTIDVEKLIRSQNMLQFIDNLKGSAYFDILFPFTVNTEHLNIFSIEMTLDVYYFNYTWKLVETLLGRNDRKMVEESFGTEVDILNIMWIMRCKKYFNTPKEIIYSFMLPKKYKLKHEQLVALVESKTVDDMLEILKKSPYKKIFEKDGIFMEQHYNKFINDAKQKVAKYMPFSIMTMLSYIHFKEIEVSNITKIIEGIRYKLDMGEIERYLIRDDGDYDGS